MRLLVTTAKQDDKRRSIPAKIDTVSWTKEHAELHHAISVGKRLDVAKIARLDAGEVRVDAGAHHR